MELTVQGAAPLTFEMLAVGEPFLYTLAGVEPTGGSIYIRLSEYTARRLESGVSVSFAKNEAVRRVQILAMTVKTL